VGADWMACSAGGGVASGEHTYLIRRGRFEVR
jgi:hypothetical protein